MPMAGREAYTWATRFIGDEAAGVSDVGVTSVLLWALLRFAGAASGGIAINGAVRRRRVLSVMLLSVPLVVVFWVKLNSNGNFERGAAANTRGYKRGMPSPNPISSHFTI